MLCNHLEVLNNKCDYWEAARQFYCWIEWFLKYGSCTFSTQTKDTETFVKNEGASSTIWQAQSSWLGVAIIVKDIIS